VWTTRAVLRERLGEPDERVREGRSAEWWSYQAKGVRFRVRIDPDSERPVLPDGGLVDAVRLTTASAGSVAGVKVGDPRERAASLLGSATPDPAGREAAARSQRFLGGGLELHFTEGDEVAWIQLYSPTLDRDAARAAPSGPTHRVWMRPISVSEDVRLEPEIRASVLEALTEHFGAIRSAFPFVQNAEAGASHVLELTLLNITWKESEIVHTYDSGGRTLDERFKCPALRVTARIGWRLRPVDGRTSQEGSFEFQSTVFHEHVTGQVCRKPDPARFIAFGAVPFGGFMGDSRLDDWRGIRDMITSLEALAPTLRVVAIDRDLGLIGIDPQSHSFSSGDTFAITVHGVQRDSTAPGLNSGSAIVLGGRPRWEHLTFRGTSGGLLWCEVGAMGLFGSVVRRGSLLIDSLPDPGCGLLTVSQIAMSLHEADTGFRSGTSTSISGGMAQMVVRGQPRADNDE
jgi:hypothetical protein